MHFKTSGLVLATFLLILLISPALAASPEDNLIGKWRSKSGKVIEFIRDGTLIVDNQGARYRVIDRERMEIDLGEVGWLSELGRRPIVRFALSNDQLTLTPLAKPDEPESFRRVKVDTLGNDANYYLKRGRKNFGEGAEKQAIEDYSKAIELDPENAQAYLARAGISIYDEKGYSKVEKFPKAIEDYSKAIGLGLKDDEAYFTYLRRGELWEGVRNYQRAIDDFGKAIEMRPGDPTAYENRGRVHYSIGNIKQVIEDYSKAIDNATKLRERGLASKPLYLARAHANKVIGNYQQAVEDYNELIEAYRAAGAAGLQVLDAHALRGDAYSLLGEYQRAMEDCDKAVGVVLRSGSKYGYYHSIRAVVYARSGNYEQAIRDCSKAIELRPEADSCYFAMAAVYSLQNDPTRACQWVKEAVQRGFTDWVYLKASKDFEKVRNASCFREAIESIKSKYSK